MWSNRIASGRNRNAWITNIRALVNGSFSQAGGRPGGVVRGAGGSEVLRRGSTTRFYDAVLRRGSTTQFYDAVPYSGFSSARLPPSARVLQSGGPGRPSLQRLRPEVGL